MAFLKKSLSEDSIDRYSHTWAFLFFVLLSITTLFVTLTLSPTMTSMGFPPFVEVKLSSVLGGDNHGEIESQSQSQRQGQGQSQGRYATSYKTTCWVPAQFTQAMVAYSHSVCGAAFNSLIRGKNSSAARLYRLDLGTDIPINPNDERSEALTPDDFRQPPKKSGNSEGTINEANAELIETIKKGVKEQKENVEKYETMIESSIQELVCYKTPLFLFLFAICLRLPHTIWALMSTCCGGINVDKTLDMIHSGQFLDPDSRSKLKEEMASSVRKCSERRTGLLYLLMKLLMVISVCILVGVTKDCLLEETDQLEDKLNTVKTLREYNWSRLYNDEMLPTMKKPDDTSSTTTSTSSGDNALEDGSQSLFDDSLYSCHFSTRRMQNLQGFEVQCLAVAENNNNNNNDNDDNSNNNDDDNGDGSGNNHRKTSSQMGSESERTGVKVKVIVLMYKSLFTMVLALLVLLVVVNILSLLVWLLKLLIPSCRSSLGLKSDTCLDLVFLVNMAWLNTTATVAMETATFCSGSSSTDGDGKRSGQVDESYKL